MEFYPLPQPQELSLREKEDASGAYLMMFAATAIGLPFPIINLIASIVYFFVNRSKGRYVRFHAIQSLYSQLPITLLNSYVVIWAIIIFLKSNPFTNIFWGLVITVLFFNIIYFVFSIIAAVKARKGKFYYFLIFGRLAYIQVYRKREEYSQQHINLPPNM
jgi:uncharacterized Tic20 family protein